MQGAVGFMAGWGLGGSVFQWHPSYRIVRLCSDQVLNPIDLQRASRTKGRC